MSAYTNADRARALQELGDSINKSISRNFGPLTEEEKKSRVIVSVNDQAEWQHSLLNQEDIDEIDDLLEVDPFVPNAPSRRSDKELGRLLDILDTLEGRSLFYDPLTGPKTIHDIRFTLETKLVACLATGGTRGCPIMPNRIKSPHFRSLVLDGMRKENWSVSELIEYGGNLDGAAALALVATLERPIWGPSDLFVLQAIERLEHLEESAWGSGLTL